MKKIIVLVLAGMVVFGMFTFFKEYDRKSDKWVAVHLLNYTTNEDLDALAEKIPALSAMGVNLIFLEVDYSFEFESHPELRMEEYITKAAAQKFSAVCKKHDIRLVPEFQSLGHQSWAEQTFPLLTKYPELDLTPGAFPGNEGIYCREWDPTNPRVYELIFPLLDEIVEAFDADGIHLGMDEVFLLGADASPATKGMDPARLYADAVIRMHDHVVKEQGLEMFIWGDRLIDGREFNYGEWEASMNGTHPAVDMIPKDIVICDWHYNTRETYPSVPHFLEKGFRVLPTSYKNEEATRAFIKYSYKLEHENMMGHLFTMWGAIEKDALLEYPSLVSGTELIQSGKFYNVVSRIDKVTDRETLVVSMDSGKDDHAIFYTTDGSDPDIRAKKYTAPVELSATTRLKMAAFQDGERMGDISEKQYFIHAAIGKNVELKAAQASDKYWPMDGVKSLLNGVGGSDSYADGQWLAFEGENMEAIIDLGKLQRLSRVALNTNNTTDNWVHAADRIEVFLSSDGQSYTKAGETDVPVSDSRVVASEIAFPEQEAHFVKIKAYHKAIPEGYPGAGSPAWLFVDEVIID